MFVIKPLFSFIGTFNQIKEKLYTSMNNKLTLLQKKKLPAILLCLKSLEDLLTFFILTHIQISMIVLKETLIHMPLHLPE